MIRISIFVCLSWLLVCDVPALAQIADADVLAYNAAAASGNSDQIRAAARQLAAASIASPEDPRSGPFAYEAAWALCQAGACAEAVPVADFAAALPVPPARASLLKAYVAWKAKPSRASAKILDAALEDIASTPPSGLSATAFLERYVSELQEGYFSDAAGLAGTAALHFAAGGEVYAHLAIEARMVAITSRFNATTKRGSLEEMIHLRGELNRRRIEGGDDAPEWIEKSFWTANAWQLAMEAYFSSVGQPGVSSARADEILESYTAGLDQADGVYDGAPDRPFCDGKFVQKPPMRYPTGQSRKGQFGAVIVQFHFEDGKVRDPRVLAAVPFDGFRDHVVETMSKWTYEPNVDPATAGCSISHDDFVQEYVFALN